MTKTSQIALIIVSEDWYFLSHRLPLARALKETGIDVHVACRVSNGKERIEREGFHLHPIEMARENLSPLSALKTISSLKKLYLEIKPDLIIHVALFSVLLGTCAALQSKTKAIVNLVTGLGYTFIAQSIKARLIRFIVKSFFRLFSMSTRVHMVVQNSDDKALMSALGFKSQTSLSLIRGSGVDASIFKPSQHNEGLVTFVGRLLWAKGVGEVAQAAHILKQRGRNYRLILVGDPDPGNPQSASEQDIENWKKNDLLEFWGRRKDIADIYNKSALALLPSWREGLPKSLLEAAACGLPMIATDVPGCREIVRHGENGLLVPLNSPLALADAIECLMENEEMRKQYGSNARSFVERELNDIVIAKQTLDLMKQKLGIN